MLHQTMIDLVIARPGTIAKYMRNLTVMDLLVEPSDHKLVVFDVRLQSRLQSGSAQANVNHSGALPLDSFIDQRGMQTPKKFNYKALRNPATAAMLATKLNADLKKWSSNLSMNCSDSDAMQFTMDNDFQLMSDSITAAATEILGTVRKAEAANKQHSTLPPTLQRQIDKLNHKLQLYEHRKSIVRIPNHKLRTKGARNKKIISQREASTIKKQIKELVMGHHKSRILRKLSSLDDALANNDMGSAYRILSNLENRLAVRLNSGYPVLDHNNHTVYEEHDIADVHARHLQGLGTEPKHDPAQGVYLTATVRQNDSFVSKLAADWIPVAPELHTHDLDTDCSQSDFMKYVNSKITLREVLRAIAKGKDSSAAGLGLCLW